MSIKYYDDTITEEQMQELDKKFCTLEKDENGEVYQLLEPITYLGKDKYEVHYIKMSI